MDNRNNLRQLAASLESYWSPRIVGQVNNQYIKVARLKGEFTWHQHDAEDEMFLVLAGELAIDIEDSPGTVTTIRLKEGEFHIVTKGTRHNPHCEDECLVALIETVSTQHTGELITHQTRTLDEQR